MSVRAPIHVVGAGLAGSEAAWQIAQRGIPVVLHEMRPIVSTPVHKTGHAAELVCSNSFRSDDALHNAVGLLHEEMRRLDSLILRMGDTHKLPAGGALAVDREGFAAGVTTVLEAHELISMEREEVAGLPPPEWDATIIATGPLTSLSLAEAIRGVTGESELAFFDAIAPIVHRDTIDMERGLAPIALRQGWPRRIRRRLPQLPDDARRNMRLSSMRSSARRKPNFASSRRRHPISTVAFRSRSWPSAAARRCGMGR